MEERSFVIDGNVANLIYEKEKQRISVIYKEKVLYTGRIQPDHVVFTQDWVGEALLRSVVEHYNRKENAQMELLAIAKSLGWK